MGQCNTDKCAICGREFNEWATKTDECQVICLKCFDLSKKLLAKAINIFADREIEKRKKEKEMEGARLAEKIGPY